MIVYKRNLDSETVAEINGYGCQASLNSDGMIAIRSSIKGVKGENKDEQMLVLSRAETIAIFNLMHQLGLYGNNTGLPY